MKQKQALLRSNLPRDNWTDGDEIKNVSTSGEAKTSPEAKWRLLFQSPSMPQKTFQPMRKNTPGQPPSQTCPDLIPSFTWQIMPSVIVAMLISGST